MAITWKDAVATQRGDPRYRVVKLHKVTTEHHVLVLPDWSHSSSWDVFVGQMEDAIDSPTVKGGELNLHRTAWAPFVLIGSEDHTPRFGLNPRAARYLARKLLEAADLCERVEFDMNWHPSQEKRPHREHIKVAAPGAPPDDAGVPHRLTAFERLDQDDEPSGT